MENMKRIRIMGLSLIAVFAFGAMVASAAQAYSEGEIAKPEYVKSVCYAMKKGKYSESGCKTLDEKKGKPKGSYERTACYPKSCGFAVAAPVTISSGASTFYTYTKPVPSERKGITQTGVGAVVECTASTGTGEITQRYTVPTIEHEFITFTGCKSEPGHVECNSEGESGGTIKTHELINRLEFRDFNEEEEPEESTVQPPLLGAWVTQSHPNETFVTFTCGSVKVEWLGGSNATAEVSLGTTPVVDKFEVKSPAEGIQKIGPQEVGPFGETWDLEHGVWAPNVKRTGESQSWGGLQSIQTITGVAGLQVHNGGAPE